MRVTKFGVHDLLCPRGVHRLVFMVSEYLEMLVAAILGTSQSTKPSFFSIYEVQVFPASA